MNTKDSLGDRMKEYEKRNQYFLQKRTPVCIRVDMKSGHSFTKGFMRPFDDVFMRSMQKTMQYMCENIQCVVFGYTQSDEITLILVDYKNLDTDCWFNYRTDKLCSISASMATMAFNKFFNTRVSKWSNEYYEAWNHSDAEDKYEVALLRASEKGAMFDARCFNIPKEEVTNLIYWRQLDATRNSIQMVGQANFSHKELQGKSCNEIQDMLMIQKSINWNDYPAECKRGAACIKTDNGWVIDKEMPILKGEDRKYVDDLVFVGE